MIVLVVNGDGPPRRLTFSQEMIIIGEGASHSVDLSFPGHGLHQNHIKIIQQKNGYLLVNQSNDPFVSLNGFPFHKQRLSIGDQIQLHQFTISVEDIQISLLDIDPKLTVLPQQVEEKEEKKLLDEFEEFEFEKSAPLLLQETMPTGEEKLSVPYSSFFVKNWKWLSVVILILSTSLGAIISELYIKASGKKEKHEMMAAEAIADVSMALTYAQLHQISPQKQYWADPEFLKNNLQALLSTTSIPCACVDAQGHLKNSSYFLRFYISSDLSRFLLIAQPSPGLYQWLFPRSTFIIDSHSMVLRKVDDLKQINRLLVDVNLLDGQHDDEIAELLNKGKEISLYQLAEIHKNGGFAPPKSLAFLRPGAENYIYNAPRYHLIGQDILNQAITLSEISNSHEKAVSLLSKFPGLVLYSTEGVFAAWEARYALEKLAPKEKFLTAYLKTDAQGKIKSSHLIMDEIWEKKEELKDSIESEIQVHEHPIESQIKSFLKERSLALTPLSLQLAHLHILDTEQHLHHFDQLYQELSDNYLNMRNDYSAKLIQVLKNLRQDYQEISDEAFLDILSHLNLQQVWENVDHSQNLADRHKFLLLLTQFNIQ